MKSSKIPRKYLLPINFLDKENTVFPLSEKFKTRIFLYSKNMVLHAEENIILHQLFESKENRISHLQKVQNKNFPIIWIFPFMQNSCFCNNFFFSFIETYVSFNHFKDLNLHYKMKYETKLRDFFLLIFNGYSMIYDNFGGNRDPLKQNLALQFCRIGNKDASILTETHINLDKFHHIRNNWFDAIFLSSEDIHAKKIACPASSAS